MKPGEFAFGLPGQDELYAIPGDLARYEELLERAIRETDEYIREGFIELFQLDDRGHQREYRKPVSLGAMSLSTVALKFGLEETDD
jgi:hypothetical protein